MRSMKVVLTKIRQQNKKWRHEQRRKKHRGLLRKQALKNKAIEKQNRLKILEGRRKYLNLRKQELNYIEQLKEGMDYDPQPPKKIQKKI